MEGWLAEIVHTIVVVIEAMAVLIIAFAAAEAFLRVTVIAVGKPDERARRAIYIRFLHWLVAALTFQLAADIAHTAIDAGWEQLGQVAAVAAIRTFTSYFLERDISQAAAEQ
jgi:uncharacterized membrane protein